MHKLKHSLSELTVPLGRRLNPRFTTGSSAGSRLVNSSSFHTISEVKELKSASKSSIVKSSTFDSLCTVDSPAKSLESEIEEALSVAEDTSPPTDIDSRVPLDTEDNNNNNIAMEVCLKTVHPQRKLAWGEDCTTKNGGDHHDNGMTFDEIRDNVQGMNSVTNSMDRYSARMPHSSTRADAFYEESATGYRRGRKMSPFGRRRAFECPISPPTCEIDERDEDDVNIAGIEVTNSEKETTVYLKHILALSSLREEENDSTDSTATNTAQRSTGSNSLCAMPSIEESDSEESENYYESEDVASVTTTPSPIVPYTLPIPTINLVDEDGTILDTILQGRDGLSAQDVNTIDHSSSDIRVGYVPKTVYDELGPSTQL